MSRYRVYVGRGVADGGYAVPGRPEASYYIGTADDFPTGLRLVEAFIEQTNEDGEHLRTLADLHGLIVWPEDEPWPW